VISAATGKAIAANPSMKEDNLSDVLHAAGGVCGLKFDNKAAAGTAPAAARPAVPATGTTGR